MTIGHKSKSKLLTKIQTPNIWYFADKDNVTLTSLPSTKLCKMQPKIEKNLLHKFSHIPSLFVATSSAQLNARNPFSKLQGAYSFRI